MRWTGPVLRQCRKVIPRRITLVMGETINGVRKVELVEHRIASRFGEDRRRRNHGDVAIAFDDGARNAAEVRAAVAVDPRFSRGHRQRLNGAAHRQQRRLQDIERIDLRDLGCSDSPRQRMHSYVDREARARSRGQQLRVTQAIDRASRIEDHRGGDNRTGKGSAARFVDAGDEIRLQSDQHRTPAARSSMATASAARLPVSIASDAPNPANNASIRRRVTVSS